MNSSENMKEIIDIGKENNYDEVTEDVDGQIHERVDIPNLELEIIENSNMPTSEPDHSMSRSNLDLKIENTIIISIENDTSAKIPVIQVDNLGLTLEDYSKENIELKKTNEILEREINLLKSLILINNLNLNTSDFKPCNFNYNFII